MAIPKEIKAIHIAKAVKDLKKEGPDNKRGSTKYCITIDGVALEPKRLISRAAYYATGRELESSDFSGGNEANKFLEELGFKTNLGSTKI